MKTLFARLMALVCAGLAVALYVTHSAGAADLNAPVTTTPTIASEIRRGADAEGQCGSLHMMRQGADLTYNDCIFGLGRASGQKVADPAPFQLGLFFAAWSTLDSMFQTALQGAPGLAPSFHDSAWSMYDVFHHLQEKIGVTDAQLLQATERNDTVRSRLEFWSKEPKPKPP